MFSQFSVGGRPKSAQRPRVGLTMKVMKDQPQLCFSCEQLFPSRARLEEHVCPAAAFICSCGTEFADYADMLTHSNTHEPGHRVQGADNVMLRWAAERREQQKQRLAVYPPHPGAAAQRGGGGAAWAQGGGLMRGPPFTLNASSSSTAGAKVNARLPPLASKVNSVMLPSGSQQQLPLQSPAAAATGSPTADLWTLYQPVVMLRREEARFNRDARFICHKCDMRFKTRRELTTHHNATHITDKVFGCIGCGVLLSSKKSVPRYHQCHLAAAGQSSSSLKMRLITARPFSERKQPGRMAHGPANNRARNGRIDLTRAPASSYRRGRGAASAASSSAPRPLQASARMQTEFMLANMANKPPGVAGNGGRGYRCQICCIDFDALQMLQRHKCAKAREFVEQQLQLGKLPNRFRKLTQPSPLAPAAAGKAPVYPVLHLNRNGNSSKPGPATMKAAFTGPAGRRPHSVRPAPAADDDDDDECFIVETTPAPAVQKQSVPASVPEAQKPSNAAGIPEVTSAGAEKESSSPPASETPDAANPSRAAATASPDVENLTGEVVSSDVEDLGPEVVTSDVENSSGDAATSDTENPTGETVTSDVENSSVPVVTSSPSTENLSAPVAVTAPDAAENLSSPTTPVAPASEAAEPVVQRFQSLNSPSPPTPVQMFQSLNSSIHIVQM